MAPGRTRPYNLRKKSFLVRRPELQPRRNALETSGLQPLKKIFSVFFRSLFSGAEKYGKFRGFNP